MSWPPRKWSGRPRVAASGTRLAAQAALITPSEGTKRGGLYPADLRRKALCENTKRPVKQPNRTSKNALVALDRRPETSLEMLVCTSAPEAPIRAAPHATAHRQVHHPTIPEIGSQVISQSLPRRSKAAVA
eukprot:11153269-Alexandrium_andersonii.AAC.1